MKKTHAIFFDIDGTIFEPGTSEVSFPVRKAISDVQSLGHFCFVASGRPATSLVGSSWFPASTKTNLSPFAESF